MGGLTTLTSRGSGSEKNFECPERPSHGLLGFLVILICICLGAWGRGYDVRLLKRKKNALVSFQYSQHTNCMPQN